MGNKSIGMTMSSAVSVRYLEGGNLIRVCASNGRKVRDREGSGRVCVGYV